MFYKFDSTKLLYRKCNKDILLILIITISLFSLLSFGVGRYMKFKSLDELEKELIIINIQNEQNKFTKEKLVEELKRLNVKFPHIVMAQSILETGHWESEIFLENHNLFGMKEARVRINTAEGTNKNHAYYNSWEESVYDYAFYQCRYLSGLRTEEEYYTYLGRSYAESDNYVSTLKSVVKRENLKKLFE